MQQCAVLVVPWGGRGRAHASAHARTRVYTQATEQDFNFDDKPDRIRFTASVQGTTPIHAVKALVQLQYTIMVRGAWGAQGAACCGLLLHPSGCFE